MKWNNFTAERIAEFACKPGTKQSIFWDGKTPGLGLRVTISGTKSFIFQTDLHGKTIRITIGDPRTWPISKAQEQASRLKVMTDQGIDPRQVRANEAATHEANETAKKAQEARDIATVGRVWEEYLMARKHLWSQLHIHDHVKEMQAGGNKRKRSEILTQPGSLASLAKIRLIELTPELVTQWAKDEARKRPTRARLALRLLRAFLFWCARHPFYKTIVTSNPAQNNDARESLGKPKVKHDALQREQLYVWFNTVKQIQNLIISSYLQTLLITGSRPNELVCLQWEDVDFQWNTLTIKDKMEGSRVIPLTPYVSHMLSLLPRCNKWVFSSNTSACGHLVSPRIAHDKACASAGLEITLHGLRRSFASLSEWIETPAGIAAQIQGHKPSGVREKHYIRRPIDLLRVWHVKIEAWILEQAKNEFIPIKTGLKAVNHP